MRLRPNHSVTAFHFQYRLQMPPKCHIQPFEAFATAKILAKREELDKQRYRDHRTQREDSSSQNAAANSIRHPLTHSTSERSRTLPRFRSATQQRNYPMNDSGDARRANYTREIDTRSPILPKLRESKHRR